MASEIEVLEDTTISSTSLVAAASTAPSAAEGAGVPAEDESLKNDMYTAAAYGDLEKLQRLVEGEGRPVTEPDGGGYHALQWAALNNRIAAVQYILEVALSTPAPVPPFSNAWQFGQQIWLSFSFSYLDGCGCQQSLQVYMDGSGCQIYGWIWMSDLCKTVAALESLHAYPARARGH